MKKSKQFGSKPQHKQAGFAPQSKANQTEEDIYVFKTKENPHEKKTYPKKQFDGGQNKKRPFKGDHNDNSGKKTKLNDGQPKQPYHTQKKHYDMITQAKQLWEQTRVKKLETEKRNKLIEELIALIQGKVLEVILKHDASRIIQTCLKFGRAQQRNQIAQELKGHFLQLVKGKYAHFLVIKILKFCHQFREIIFKEFQGQFVALVRHKEAAPVIEELFTEHANSKQRALMLVECYGPEFTLFQQAEKTNLKEYFVQYPEKRQYVMANISEVILSFMNKGTVRLNFVHQLISEYLENANENEKTELIETIKESIPEMVHTKKGHKVAIECIIHGNTKQRKAILKAMKDFVVATCKDSYGHLVIIELFETIDDTVLMQKSVLAPMIKSLPELIADKFGRRPILYLLCGRSPKYFIPQIIAQFKDFDTVRQKTTKKDPTIRRNELLSYLIPELGKLIEEDGRSLIKDPFSSEVVCEALLHSGDQREHLMNIVASYVNDKEEEENGAETKKKAVVPQKPVTKKNSEKNELFDEDDEDEDEDEDDEGKKNQNHFNNFGNPEKNTENIMTHIIANRILKRLIKQDSKSSIDDPKFGPILLSQLEKNNNLNKFANNWGAVVLVTLLESPLTQSKVLNSLKPSLKELSKSTNPSTTLLVKSIQTLMSGGKLHETKQEVKPTKDKNEKKEEKKKKNKKNKKNEIVSDPMEVDEEVEEEEKKEEEVDEEVEEEEEKGEEADEGEEEEEEKEEDENEEEEEEEVDNEAVEEQEEEVKEEEEEEKEEEKEEKVEKKEEKRKEVKESEILQTPLRRSTRKLMIEEKKQKIQEMKKKAEEMKELIGGNRKKIQESVMEVEEVKEVKKGKSIKTEDKEEQKEEEIKQEQEKENEEKEEIKQDEIQETITKTSKTPKTPKNLPALIQTPKSSKTPLQLHESPNRFEVLSPLQTRSQRKAKEFQTPKTEPKQRTVSKLREQTLTAVKKQQDFSPPVTRSRKRQ